MIQIAHNAVNAKIVGASREEKLEIHRLLSYSVQGSEHMPGFKSSGWDGTSSFFSFEKETFPVGFVHLVTQGLQAFNGAKIQIVAKPAPEPLGPERPEVDDFGYTDRYDYHPETIDRLVRHKRIIAQIATGGGKSRIARIGYKRIGRRTLFLTTRSILAHQMARSIEEMDGTPVAMLGDGEWGIPYEKADGTKGRRLTQFVCATVQTLVARLEKKTVQEEMQSLKDRRATAMAKRLDAERKKMKEAGATVIEIGNRLGALTLEIEKQQGPLEDERARVIEKVAKHEQMRLATIDILAKFEFVIAEEAHEVSGNSFYAVMECCRNAVYRMALTATPFMKDDEEANMRLMAACGPVAIQVTEKMLIDRGILARPYFKYVAPPEALKPKALYRTTPWQKAYDVGIVHNEWRNKALCAEVLRGRVYGLNAMMLVQRKEHGQLLADMLTRAGLRAEFIYGEDDQKARQRALRALGLGELDVLIGSTILDVGVDVPSVGMIVLGGGGKAEVAQRQRIGRGLREKKGLGAINAAFIVDVADDFNNHLKGHAQQRRAIVDGTPGFAEGVVRDFDFPALGYTRAAIAA